MLLLLPTWKVLLQLVPLIRPLVGLCQERRGDFFPSLHFWELSALQELTDDLLLLEDGIQVEFQIDQFLSLLSLLLLEGGMLSLLLWRCAS